MEALLNSRRGIKAALTRTISKHENDLDKYLVLELEELLAKVLKTEEKYEDNFDKLVELYADNIDDFDSDRIEFESKISAFKAKIRSYCSKSNQDVSPIELQSQGTSEYEEIQHEVRNEEFFETPLQEEQEFAQASQGNGQQSALERAVEALVQSQATMLNTMSKLSALQVSDQSPLAPENKHVKLPFLNLPSFDGSYKDWTNFRDLFQSAVHDSKVLSDSQKLQYLKTSLVGEAASSLKHITITNANYELAWKELNARYGRDKLIVNAHLKVLTNLKPLLHASQRDLRVFVSSVTESVGALKALGLPVDFWDSILVYIISTKLDPESFKLWNRKNVDVRLPTYKSLVDFLFEREFEISAVPIQSQKTHLDQIKAVSRKFVHFGSVQKDKVECPKCQGKHFLSSCAQFKSLAVTARKDFVSSKRLCFNCFNSGHMLKECRCRPCRICSKPHHTLLHFESKGSAATTRDAACNLSDGLKAEKTSVMVATSEMSLLPTAQAFVFVNGRKYRVNLLIDSGAQLSLITEKCAQLIGTKRQMSKMSVSGVGAKTTIATRGCINLTLYSKDESESVECQLHVLPKLTSRVPIKTVSGDVKNIFNHLSLADPEFWQSKDIDIILGVDCVCDILRDGVVRCENLSLIAQQSVFGWVVSGISPTLQPTQVVCANFLQCEETLKKFWELEEINVDQKKSQDDIDCETYFKETVSRSKTGKFIVRLPFSKSPECLGNSVNIARARLTQLEKRLDRNELLKQDYISFMEEYKTLGHMRELEGNPSDAGYYLPHHAVLKESSSTTKLRVVFNASSRTYSGKSLNDILFVGEKLQTDIFDILLRFRLHRVAYAADICKMYRQIEVHPEDCRYQKVLWRENSTNPIKSFELQTVTYGTACAPFLALRVLKELAHEVRLSYPVVSKVIDQDFYVDDVVSGCETIEQTKQNISVLQKVMQSAGFLLRKWVCNVQECLSEIPVEDREKLDTHNFDVEEGVKTLGVFWAVSTDTFMFTYTFNPQKQVTKRVVLSTIAKIFDPVGFLAPVIVRFKILMQKLWLTGITWDDPIPSDLANKWFMYMNDLSDLKRIKIPRWYQNEGDLFLVGFSDASEEAYAAVVYLTTDKYLSNLKFVAAKSKVSPIRKVTIPKLELCGALLVANLIKRVSEILNIKLSQCVAFTDSTIVLAWLSDVPRRWPTFIGNRTCQILDILPRAQWFHIKSQRNPADAASRGLPVSGLIDNSLWFEGPDSLHLEMAKPSLTSNFDCLEHDNVNDNVLAVSIETNSDNNLFALFSSFTKLVRVTSWCYRFIQKCRGVKAATTYLSSTELQATTMRLIIVVQKEVFIEEINALQRGHVLPRKNRLSTLCPFVDEHGLLRANGRVENAQGVCSPIILPKKHPFCTSLLLFTHLNHLHPGPQMLFALIRKNFFVFGLKSLVKYVCRNCVTCAKARGSVVNQQMGPLPSVRTEIGRPFKNVGVDYAGPVAVKSWKGRGAKVYKSYIALFVCLSTKAIHLELVSDLSTDSFIASLRRFISRRSAPSCIFSDNGTNFLGASNSLKEFYNKLQSKEAQSEIQSFLSEGQTAWKFIPPAAPHFGGLWEAGVRSVKHHLRSVLKESTLTFEEMATLLCQIEGALNSRPLTAVIDSNENCELLTPAHFLTGGPLKMLPETEDVSINIRFSERWAYIQRLFTSIWKKWSQQYLTQLQVRTKWINSTETFKEGCIVLIKDESLPASKWLLAKVIKVHPGKDGLVRVVSLKTQTNILKRPVNKIVLLPTEKVEP